MMQYQLNQIFCTDFHGLANVIRSSFFRRWLNQTLTESHGLGVERCKLIILWERVTPILWLSVYSLLFYKKKRKREREWRRKKKKKGRKRKKNHFLFKNYFKGGPCLELLQYYCALFFKRATIANSNSIIINNNNNNKYIYIYKK